MAISRYAAYALFAGLALFVTRAHAADFHGAHVTDTELPGVYLKVGLYGFRPVIVSVAPDSPAAKLGFRSGDIILSINDKEVKRAAELTQFTTDISSASLFRGTEQKRLSLDRRPHETAKAKRAGNERLSEAHRSMPAAALHSPPAKPADRATENKAGKPAPGTPVDAVQRQEPFPRQRSLETALFNREQAPSSLALLSRDKPAQAQNDLLSRVIKPAQDKVIFKNDRGDVIFSHSIHLKSLSELQCLLCHQTKDPTPELILSRLDNHRAAHGFCRGCHQKTAQGPSEECHVCHVSGKVSHARDHH